MKFSETHDGISYLYDYYPVRYEQHHGISEKILAFKDGDDDAIKQFAFDMKDAMDEKYKGCYEELKDTVICVMPSHEIGKYGKGLSRIAAYLIYFYGMSDGTHLIERTKTHDKISWGGDRSVLGQLDTLSVNENIEITGKDVIILDDVTTTGNSIEAARRLLRLHNAGKIYAQTIGKTFGSEDETCPPIESFFKDEHSDKTQLELETADEQQEIEQAWEELVASVAPAGITEDTDPKTEKESKKRSTKQNFHLTKEQARRFGYENFMSVHDMCLKLNSLRTVSDTKVVRQRTIKNFLYENEYVSDKFIDGVWRKIISEKGRAEGICYIKRVSVSGFEHSEIGLSKEIQKKIVESFTTDPSEKVVGTEQKPDAVEERSEDSGNAKIWMPKENVIWGQTEYNRSMNRPDGAGRPWTSDEENVLRRQYKAGMKIDELAKDHCRTNGGIRSRLKKLGMIK